MKGMKSVKFVSTKNIEGKEKDDEPQDKKKKKEYAPKTPKSKDPRKGKTTNKSFPKK